MYRSTYIRVNISRMLILQSYYIDINSDVGLYTRSLTPLQSIYLTCVEFTLHRPTKLISTHGNQFNSVLCASRQASEGRYSWRTALNSLF